MKILAIIPARGGSKGIPRKNIRLLNGEPLISYAIKTAIACKYINDVFVTTDNDDIAYIAGKYGAEVIKRDEKLSSDMVTLDPVIFDACNKVESLKRCEYDAVITLQPTSPLLSIATLESGIETFMDCGVDTLISAVNKPHLSWGIKDNEYYPLYNERKNRQELPPQYFETGAFVITKREFVTLNSRLGKNISIFEVPKNESIDIDDKMDWILAEALLKRKKIVFRVEGYAELGMGHIYNCITLAHAMIEHDLLFVISKKSIEGILKIKETFLPYVIINSDDEIDNIIEEYKPDIWINDCLNTTYEYMDKLKSRIKRVISIEDLGTGTNRADAVINALYDNCINDKIYSGWKYVCLREEFLLEQPRVFSENVSNIIIMFGGTDPTNLNKMVYETICSFAEKYRNIKFYFITGIGYNNIKHGVLTNESKNIYVYPNVSRVTKYMKCADLAITSQGRTIFELAAMGIPSIVLSQNEREKTHKFAQMENGFLNLGIGKDINIKSLENTLEWLISTPSIRENMYKLMQKYPLRDGIERVKRIILGEENE